MALVPAKCTNCGGQIDVDDSKEAGICKHCGTAFITEKAINNYTTTYNVTNNVTKIINGKEVDEGEDFYNRAMTHLKLEEYSDAREAIGKAIKKNPDNAEFRFAEVLIETQNFTDLDYVLDSKLIDNLLKTANDKQKQQWTKDYGYDFTQTKNDFVVDVYRKKITSLNYEVCLFETKLLDKLNEEQISKLFANSKNKIIEYLSGINVDAMTDYSKQGEFERLLSFAFEHNVFEYKEKCELVSAYLDAYVDPEYKNLLITENNFSLFVKDDVLYVPYQQVEILDMLDFKKSKIKKGKLPEMFSVTPNIKNVETCEKLEEKYFDAVVFVDYDDEDKTILKEIYNVDNLSKNNKLSKPTKKRSKTAKKIGGFLGWLKDFFVLLLQSSIFGIVGFVVFLVGFPIVSALFSLVPSNDVWSVAFKWALVVGGVVWIGFAVYTEVSATLSLRKSRKEARKEWEESQAKKNARAERINRVKNNSKNK